MKNNHIIHVRADDETYENLKYYCNRFDVSNSEAIRRGIAALEASQRKFMTAGEIREMPASAVKTLAILCSLAESGKVSKDNDDICTASGMSRPTIAKALKSLRESKAISVRKDSEKLFLQIDKWLPGGIYGCKD